MPDEKTQAIARLNDLLRTTFMGGRVLTTCGVHALSSPSKNEILSAVREFDAFSPDNDPYGEHDCAVLEVAGQKIIFKIDYYDPTFTYHSADPSDPSLTHRVLTIMLAGEY